jgi:lipid A 3-O-deacylase
MDRPTLRRARADPGPIRLVRGGRCDRILAFCTRAAFLPIRVNQIPILVALLLLAGPAQARTAEAEPGNGSRGSFNFLFENDIFGAQGSDRHYTQGLRLSWLTPEERVWNWVRSGARKLPFYPRGGRLRATYSAGQNLYTPEDIRTSDLVVDDRPYAAWLYLAAGLVADTGRSLDLVEFSLGVVGPSALGEELQSWFHALIASPDPQGWHHQLHDELTVQLFYERKWRKLWAPAWLDGIGLETEVTPHVGAALGNVFVQAATGGTLRFGNDLPADYGAPRIRPSLPGSEFFVPATRFSAYAFAGLEVRGVAHNIFLDGNTFGSSHSVEKNPIVGDFQGGLAIVIVDVRLAFTYVYRTPEFELQNEPDRFGAITFSARF